MFAHMPFEVRPCQRFDVEFGNLPSIPLLMHGVYIDSLRQYPLDSASTISTTSNWTNKDVIELHLMAERWTDGSALKSADQLLQWMKLLHIPWAYEKSVKYIQRWMKALVKEFLRLQKNFNARANRGGSETASNGLSRFLERPFITEKKCTKVSRPSPSASRSYPVTPPPAPDETCPSSSSLDESQMSMDVSSPSSVHNPPVSRPSPSASRSCPVTPPPAPDETCPSSSSLDESQMSMDVSSPSSVYNPPGFQATPVSRPRSIFATPGQNFPTTHPLTSTPNQTCPSFHPSQSPVTSLSFASSPPDKENVPSLRCGKHRPTPEVGTLQQKLQKVTRKNQRLLSENIKLQNVVGMRNRDIVNQLEKEKAAAVTSITKQLTKALTRTETELQRSRKCNEKLSQENSNLREQCIELLDVAEEEEKKAVSVGEYAKRVASDKHKLQKKLRWKEQKIDSLLNKFESDANIAETIHNEIVVKLKKENEDLSSRFGELSMLEAKEGKRYSAEIRLVYYDRLTKGVSCNIIQHVVRRVLETLSGKDVKDTDLPSRTTAQRMKVEAGYLVKLRAAWEWKERADKSAVFQTDKTTKGQLEWLSIVVKLRPNSSEDSTFTLCLEPVSSGTSEHTLDTFSKCLDELCEIAVDNKIATYEEAKKVYSLKNIIGHMSDRAATETKLTRLLVEKKAAELREEGLTDNEVERRSKVYNFTCSLHKINNTAVAMTQSAEKHLNFDAAETSGTRHIYQTDKLICTESNKEYAQGTRFRSFCLSSDQLEESGSSMFKPIVGGRYLVYCENAIPTYCCKDLVMLFLQDLKEVKRLNRLEANVYNRFLDMKIMAEVRALGVVFHDLLHPLFIKALKAPTPLALNDDYHFTCEKMDMFAVDPAPLLKGTDPCIRAHHHPCRFDRYMDRLRAQDDETEEQVLSLLKVMCQAGAEKLRKHAEEHLPGGAYYWNDFNPQLAKAASIVGDSTNNAVESRFAAVDNQMTRCRRSNPLSVGGNVAAKQDHIVEFLESQSKEIQEEMCISAMKGGRQMASKKGTKNQQLKRLYEEGEPARQAKKMKAQERKRKAEEKRRATQQALANGELIQDVTKLDASLTVAALKRQCHLWQNLGDNFTVQQGNLLRGYYKKSKPQLLDVLCQIVELNSSLDVHHQSDNENDNESSSSDEDDLELV